MKKILLIFAVLFITVLSYSQTYTTSKLKADTILSRDGTKVVFKDTTEFLIAPSYTDLSVSNNLEVSNIVFFDIDTIADGDVTPDVSTSNMITYKGSTEALTITDLDNAKPGVIYTIIGGEYPITIESGGFFKIGENITIYNNDVVSFVCMADNYYVSTYRQDNLDYDWYVATTGNDGNSGTIITDPFLTLGAANTAASNGDKILMLPGTYNMGTISISKQLTIDGYGATLTDNAPGAAWFTLSGTEVKTFNGIIWEGDAVTTAMFTCGTSSNNNWNDCEFNHAGQLDYPFYNGYGVGTNTITNSYVQCGSDGIMFAGISYDFDGCTIDSVRNNGFYKFTNTGTLTVQNGIINIYSDFLIYGREDGWNHFIDNTINLIGNIDGLTAAGTGAGGSKNIQFDGNTIIAGSFTATNGLINSSSANEFDTIYISDNIITSTGDIYAIYLYPDDTCSITGNTITLDGLGSNIGIYVRSGGKSIGAYIAENKIYQKGYFGYNIAIGNESSSADDDKVTAIVEKNYVKAAYSFDENRYVTVHGYWAGYNKDVIYKYNYIDGAKYGIIYKHGGTDMDGYAMYNIVEGCRESLRSKGAASCKFYNNTLVANLTNDSTVAAISLTVDNAGDLADTCDIRNNIIYYDTGVESTWILTDATSGKGHTINYNLCYGVSDDPYYAIDGVSYNGWSTIQAGGFETNGVNDDPEFEVGYYLKTASPAYETGYTLGATYVTGLSRTTVWPSAVVTATQPTKWTIGAYID